MNKVINKELSEKPKLKKDIEKILYNSSKIDRQLNIVSEINGDIKIIETKLNLLLLKCQNDIIKNFFCCWSVIRFMFRHQFC